MPQPIGVSSPIGTKQFGVKKRSVNALSSRIDTNSKFNALNSTHMTVTSDVSASNNRLSEQPKNDSMFRATDSTFLHAGSNAATSLQYNSKPQLKVISLSPEEGAQIES